MAIKFNNNNILQYDKQISFNGNAYLDPNIGPFQTKAELNNVPQTHLFNGLEVVVLRDETNGNHRVHYIYDGQQWVLNEFTIDTE